MAIITKAMALKIVATGLAMAVMVMIRISIRRRGTVGMGDSRTKGIQIIKRHLGPTIIRPIRMATLMDTSTPLKLGSSNPRIPKAFRIITSSTPTPTSPGSPMAQTPAATDSSTSSETSFLINSKTRSCLKLVNKLPRIFIRILRRR